MDSDRFRETAEYYDKADLSEHIERASWEEHTTTTEPMVSYALRLPKPVIDQLRVAAQKRDMRVTTLMREWLEERLIMEAEADEEAMVPVSALLALVAERGSKGRAS